MNQTSSSNTNFMLLKAYSINGRIYLSPGRNRFPERDICRNSGSYFVVVVVILFCSESDKDHCELVIKKEKGRKQGTFTLGMHPEAWEEKGKTAPN